MAWVLQVLGGGDDGDVDVDGDGAVRYNGRQEGVVQVVGRWMKMQIGEDEGDGEDEQWTFVFSIFSRSRSDIGFVLDLGFQI